MRIIASIFIIFSLAAQLVFGDYVHAQTTDDLQQELRIRNAEIESIGSRISDYEKRLEELSKRQAGLSTDIAVITNEVGIAQLDVEALQLSIDAQRLQIEIIENQVQEATAGLKRQKMYLRDIVVGLQRSEGVTPVEIVFSAQGMHEALSTFERVETLSARLDEQLKDTRTLRDELQVKQNTQQEKVNSLVDLESELEARIIALEQRKLAVDLLIRETNNSESQYRVIMSDLRQEQQGITSRILDLQEAIQKRIRDEGGEDVEDSSQTTITYPLKNYIITAIFNDPTYPFRHLFPHSGLDMAAPMGTPIYAAAPGVVSWARSGTTGYGNYVMIIHDNGLATLYAHMSGFAVAQDQYVSRGEVIGYVGSTGFSTGPHLHFEVRLNGVPVNPQAYLQ